MRRATNFLISFQAVATPLLTVPVVRIKLEALTLGFGFMTYNVGWQGITPMRSRVGPSSGSRQWHLGFWGEMGILACEEMTNMVVLEVGGTLREVQCVSDFWGNF